IHLRWENPIDHKSWGAGIARPGERIMNNPNDTADEPSEPQDVVLSSAVEVEEAAPRSYIAAGVVASLLIVLLCVLGVAVLSSGVLTARPSPPQAPAPLT